MAKAPPPPPPVTVAVIGLPSAQNEGKGSGKSCICDRFLHPSPDEYTGGWVGQHHLGGGGGAGGGGGVGGGGGGGGRSGGVHTCIAPSGCGESPNGVSAPFVCEASSILGHLIHVHTYICTLICGKTLHDVTTYFEQVQRIVA